MVEAPRVFVAAEDHVGELARFYGIVVRIHTRGEHPTLHEPIDPLE